MKVIYMENIDEAKNVIAIVDKETVENLIYIVRGQKVMLDVDLARIYGYETRRFNEQVKNNSERFDDDFRFQLTKPEFENLMSKNSTSSWGGTRKLPYAFTETGIYMLMTVLKGDLAIAQSKALIRIFKGMKDYISENRALIGTDDIARLAIQTSENTAAIAKITDEMLRKSDLPKIFKNFASSDTGKEFLIMNGQLAEADAAYQGIYAKAKNSIFIIDDYIGIKSIMHLRNVNPGVMITVFSDNKQSHLRRADLNDFRNEFPGILIDFKKTNNTMHDRYIILDYGKRSEKIYHCGASSKDAGKKTTTIMEVQDRAVYKQLVDVLICNPALRIT